MPKTEAPRLRLLPLALMVAAVMGGMSFHAEASFGLTEEAQALVVDSGAGLVFKVSKSNGDILSICYRGGPELQDAKRHSHIASGLGSATKVSGAVVGGSVVRIAIETDESNKSAKSLTHYLIVRSGVNSIYMATFPTTEPNVGELRWITRLEKSRFPVSPGPSNIREAAKPIESKDVYGCEDGTTRSKYFGDSEGRGKDRAMDMTYCGVTGPGVGVWMVYGSRESSSGGPFHRDIQNQTVEVYNYMNSGHNMTEPPRLGVLHGPYALTFTDGAAPAPVDFSWIDTAGLDLKGYVPVSQRGTVTGKAGGIPSKVEALVGFSNASAQYWAKVGTDGTYQSPLMKPGTYEAKLYQGELAVADGTVVVEKGGKAKLDLSAMPIAPALFRIGEWDGTPKEFRNGDKLVAMHPSDKRMSAWGPVTFVAGSDADEKFPSLQLRQTNSPMTIEFNLKPEEVQDRVLRIGVTCIYNRARPVIKVNQWSPRKVPDSVNQPDSRSYTIGTYRGNNHTFTFTIPASAFVAGKNRLTISPTTGTSDLSPWLSAGWAYDAVQLDAAPAR